MTFTWKRIGKLAAAVVLGILTGWFVAFWRWWHFGPSQRILRATRKWSELLHGMGEEADDEESRLRREAEAWRRAMEGLLCNTQRVPLQRSWEPEGACRHRTNDPPAES